MSRMLREGPKVFAFDALTCEALENFDLSVSTADYLQPFPTVIIELPQDYTKKRVVPFDDGIRVDEGVHAPDYLVIRHEPKAGCVLVLMHMTSHQVLTRLLKLDPAWTLEEMWTKGQTNLGCQGLVEHDPGGKSVGKFPEQAGAERVPDGDGVWREDLGPANPSHYERLKKFAKLARKRGQEAEGKGRNGASAGSGEVCFRPGSDLVPS